MGRTVSSATYHPNAFYARDLAHAKRVTVGDIGFDDGSVITCEERWDVDTRYTLKFIRDLIPLSKDDVVLDYGAGTGRIAKGLIEEYDCRVIGLDSSPSLIKVATAFVASTRYLTVEAGKLSIQALRPTFAISLWVIQHCMNPAEALQEIRESLPDGGKFLLFNENKRYVPTVEYGFVHDNIEILDLADALFNKRLTSGKLDPEIVSPQFSERTYWALYEK